MKYIKFVLKCILAASPAILLIAYTLLLPFCYMDEEYPSWKYSKDVAKGSKSVAATTLILGDSGAMSSFVPKQLSEGAVNMAVGGGTSIEMYYFLKEYLDNHDAPKSVVIMFAPFHYFNIDNYSTRTIYFKAIDKSDLKELYLNAGITMAEAVLYDGVLMDEFSCRMGLPTKYLPAIKASRFVGRYKSNRSAYDELLATRGYGPFGELDGCDDLSYECSYKKIIKSGNSDILKLYLQKIFTLCDDNNISVLLVQPALNEPSYNAIDQNYVSGYEAYVEEIAGGYENVTYENKLRCYPSELFGDVSHLNKKGAVIFTAEIKEKYPDYFE